MKRIIGSPEELKARIARQKRRIDILEDRCNFLEEIIDDAFNTLNDADDRSKASLLSCICEAQDILQTEEGDNEPSAVSAPASDSEQHLGDETPSPATDPQEPGTEPSTRQSQACSNEKEPDATS